MKANRLWIAALAVSAFSAITLGTKEAQAMSFSLDFTDNSLFSGIQSSVDNVDLGAVEIDVSAVTRGGGSRNLNFFGNGVGINGGGSPTINGSSGMNRDEILQLNFSKAVRFDSIRFANIADGNDNFTLRIDGNLFGNVNTAIPSNSFTLATGFGNLFEIAALGANDDFRIASITGEVIPTPALLPGLLGLGAAALRRRRQEATDA